MIVCFARVFGGGVRYTLGLRMRSVPTSTRAPTRNPESEARLSFFVVVKLGCGRLTV